MKGDSYNNKFNFNRNKINFFYCNNKRISYGSNILSRGGNNNKGSSSFYSNFGKRVCNGNSSRSSKNIISIN